MMNDLIKSFMKDSLAVMEARQAGRSENLNEQISCRDQAEERRGETTGRSLHSVSGQHRDIFNYQPELERWPPM